MTQSIQTEWITLTVADTPPMEAYWAHPEGKGPWPGVLVLMEIFGVNTHIQEVTERLAAEGYAALAINFYHRTTLNLNLGYSAAEVAIGREHKEKTTRQGIFEDVETAIHYLQGSPEVAPKDRFGAMGFCFGGHVAYLAATLPEIAATASFYGGGIATMTPGGGAPTVTETPKIQGKILCLFGDQDPLISMRETVEIEKALTSAGVDHEVVHYPEAGHGFFCNQRSDYNPHAAQDAWTRVKDLFAQTLKP